MGKIQLSELLLSHNLVQKKEMAFAFGLLSSF